MASLTLEHVGKKYPNGYEGVKDFNLEIADKEFIIFVGPSGCGKSTTLRMIAGLEDITSGTLKIDDRVVNDVEPKDRDIAMVFQTYALYPHMSVYDNMAFPLKLRKVDSDTIDKAVREAARILDLEKLLDRKPSALSGGQRQRVAMGRAIVRAPKVYLMDEPLSNLDAKLRVQMRAEISKLHDRLGATIIYVTHDQTEAMTLGTRIVVMKDGVATIIYVTHDQTEAMTLGTRIVVMKDGVMQQVDTPTKLYNEPCNLFVAGFIGSPQMNFIDVQVSEKGAGVALTFGSNTITLTGPKADVLKKGGYVGKVVVMGIRPEDVVEEHEYAEGRSLSETFPANVTVYELLGSEAMIYADVDGGQISAHLSASSAVRTGSKIKCAVDLAKIHLFDKQSELAIAH